MPTEIKWLPEKKQYLVTTDTYEAILAPTGVSMGLHSLKDRTSGKEWVSCWTKQREYMGLKPGDRLAILNPYHYLAKNLVAGTATGREMPATHSAHENSIVIDCSTTEKCKIASRYEYKFNDTPFVELNISVEAQDDYFGFELWLSSYVLGRTDQPHYWCKDRDNQASWVAPVKNRFIKDFYLAFPRDNQAAALTFDGRWGDNEYQTFLNGPYYAKPLMAVPDKDAKYAYVEFGQREEVSKISGAFSDPDWTAGCPSNNDTRFYTVLFGQDIKKGQTLKAKVKAGIIPINGNINSCLDYL